MDGNGEAAGHFQLKVGGLFIGFSRHGSSSGAFQISCEVKRNGCFTTAFQAFQLEPPNFSNARLPTVLSIKFLYITIIKFRFRQL